MEECLKTKKMLMPQTWFAHTQNYSNTSLNNDINI